MEQGKFMIYLATPLHAIAEIRRRERLARIEYWSTWGIAIAFMLTCALLGWAIMR